MTQTAQQDHDQERRPVAPTHAGGVVDCAEYAGGRRTETTVPVERLRSVVRGTKGFLWVDLRQPTADDMRDVAAQLDLPELAVEDAVHAHQRPKLDTYGEHIFAVLKPVDAEPVDAEPADAEPGGQALRVSELAVFVGPRFLVTVRHGDSALLDRVRRAWEVDPSDTADRAPAVLLYRIADAVVDDYEAILADIQSDVDDVEETVFGGDDSDHAECIYQLKRRVAEMRRVIFPLVVPTQRLATGAVDGIDGELSPYFRDVHDHVLRAAEVVESADRLLSDVLQADQSRLAVRQNEIALRQNDVAAQQNEDMRRMSAWAAIALLPTAVAGIYGMNFDNMPELHWKYGYFMVLGGIAAACVGLYVSFRRNGWL
jgi:magnesium transporter